MLNKSQTSSVQMIIGIPALVLVFILAFKFPNPTLWLIIGILLASFVTNDRFPKRSETARHILHFSIVLMGFGVPIAEVIHVGCQSIPLTLASISATIIVGITLYRWFKIDHETGFLLTVGTTICGGSAIAAVSGAIDADSKTIAKSTIIVFALNAVALFVFPLLGRWLHMDASQFGYWSALAIHDTSSVVGAASTYGDESLRIAILIKLTRSLWIIPVSIIASLLWKTQGHRRIHLPWFIFGFIAAASLVAFTPQWNGIWSGASRSARPLFAVALFLIGTQMNFRQLKESMNRELIMAILLWLIVSVVSAAFILRYVH